MIQFMTFKRIHDSFLSLFLHSFASRPNCTLRLEFPNSKKILEKVIRNRIDETIKP